MKGFAPIILSALLVLSCAGVCVAGSSKTWSNIGKGLAIYEGAKVVTGRQGNILDDVTGGMQPRQQAAQQQPQASGTYQDGYNAGYQSGYDNGYNAGFRKGVEQSGR